MPTQDTPRRGLGRGLGALLPQRDAAATSPRYFECDLERLRPAADQPRKTFDPDKLRELVDSVREQGIIQPIVARPDGEGLVIVAGERRWRAARMAGLPTVPVVVKDIDGAEAFEVALVENVQRDDLNPIEEAEAYQYLLQLSRATQEKVAERVGKDRATVANLVRLLGLPAPVQDKVRTGRLSAGVARALLGLRDEQKILDMAEKAESRGMSARAVEAAVQKAARPTPPKAPVPTEAERIAEKLERLLGFEVELAATARTGKLTVRWAGKQAREALEKRLDVLLE